ncbi:hypothetical protein LWI28_001453 [Acer negundo]|uniref:Uncharacterized protein n=1 Tax=Acer negundo TaxID=4023 RepID=A0AAD5P530_ACENE|nr:hypothetical protein LWI28_001453 [Acer negundo]
MGKKDLETDGCSVAVPGVPHMGVYHQLMCPGNGDLRRSDALLLMAANGIKRILPIIAKQRWKSTEPSNGSSKLSNPLAESRLNQLAGIARHSNR